METRFLDILFMIALISISYKFYLIEETQTRIMSNLIIINDVIFQPVEDIKSE